jgi:hypothetical protein
MAVLSRVNAALLPVQAACVEAGLPCTTPLGPQVLERTGVRTALAYLRIGLDPDHIARADVTDTIRRPSRGIAPKVVEMLTKRSSTSIGDIRRLADYLTGRDGPKLHIYADGLEMLTRSCRQSTVAALRTIRVGIGLGDTMDVLDSTRREADRSTHADDLIALEGAAQLHGDAATFEPWLRQVLSRPPAAGDPVLLSTVHRVKGREWGHVIVYGASRGLFPHRLSDDTEGERRVFHVAVTRARTQAVVLADEAAPSPFVAELDGTRPHEPVAPPKAPPPARASGGSRRPEVPAEVGMKLEYGGHAGEVVEVRDAAVILEVGAAQVPVRFGADVRVDGALVVLAPPPPPLPAHAAAAEQALRAWRGGIAKRDRVPAYVILNDKELTGIVARDPRDLSALARCRGIGASRLERFGDEILAVLESARAAGDP